MLQNNSRITIHETVLTFNVTGGRVEFVKSILEVCGVEDGDKGEYSCIVASGGAEEYDIATFQLNMVSVGRKSKASDRSSY